MSIHTQKELPHICAVSRIVALSFAMAAVVSNGADGSFVVTETETFDQLVAGETLSAGGAVFSDWQVNRIVGTGGALAPALSDITVEVGFDDLGRPGVRYLLGAAVGPGQAMDLDFTYNVSSDVAIELVEALLDGAAANGTGIVSVAETLFATFPAAPVGTLSVSTLSAPHLFGQSVVVPALEMLVVRKDVVLSGGLSGTASLSSFFQLYQVVPEPAAIGLWLVGAAVVWSANRRRAWK